MKAPPDSATASRLANWGRAYSLGIRGDCHRPACGISTTETPALARLWADPTRRLWPEMRPSLPAWAARVATIDRTARALGFIYLLHPVGRKVGLACL